MSGRTNEPLRELEQQNRELLSTLEQLNLRQSELVQLNKELEETNRGVVALYAEINDKADYLQRASELKSKFLSNMSHEFRTPLNSILALSRILLDRLDGDLTREQEKQVQFIRRSADNLLELVNDLLDLAKVEAGKITVRPVHFDVGVLFGSLRSVLKPLLVSQRVELVFEDPEGIPPLFSDESKVAQILRNFISNALKFTERGEVRVCARMIENGLGALLRAGYRDWDRSSGSGTRFRGVLSSGQPGTEDCEGYRPRTAALAKIGDHSGRHGDRGKHSWHRVDLSPDYSDALPGNPRGRGRGALMESRWR